MTNRIRTLAVNGTLLTLLASCGGGGGDAPGAPTSPDRTDGVPGAAAAAPDGARRGVFVDSAVANLAWSTPSRSGVTGADGAFEYLPGETITFSIGALRLPPVAAAERLTPLDLARTATDPERYAVNLARLLQSLDEDGDVDNGIRLPADAATIAGEIAFDVEAETFEGDAAVLNLVAGSGGVRRELVSIESARTHFGYALAEAPAAGSTSAIAGLWALEGTGIGPDEFVDDTDGSLTDYDDIERPARRLAISDDGELLSLSENTLTTPSCFDVDHQALTPIGGDDYLVSSLARGGMERASVSLKGDTLEILHEDDYAYYQDTATRAPEGDVSALPLCAGQSLQRPPADAGVSASIAGLWERDRDGVTDFYRISARGTAEYLAPLEVFGPAPDYAPSVCHTAVDFTLDPDGHGSFEAYSDIQWTFRILDPRGDALVVTDPLGADPDVADPTFVRSETDTATLVRCDADTDRHPLDAVAGLWRDAGDGIYGRYVEIERTAGTMTTYEPGLGALDCFVETRSALGADGGLDFVRTLSDGTEQALRMEPGDDRLVISDIAADGSGTPVRWLESIVGLDTDALSLCEATITPADLDVIGPLVGTWSYTESEYDGPYGPNGADIVYRSRTTYWTIAPDGGLERETVSRELEDHYLPGASDYRICREYSRHRPTQIDPVGSDVFRIDGESYTMSRAGTTLNVNTPYSALALERSDVQPAEIAACDSYQESDFAEARGVWSLAAFEPGLAGAFLTIGDYSVEVDRHDEQEGCRRTQELYVDELGDGRVVLSGQDDDGGSIEAVARFSTIDGELDIAIESGGSALGFAAGRYPAARGVSIYGFGYANVCY